ncbi:hypothetical protein LTR02_008959 [Friedmanniomyces endolithicus]|nr:hypothetical protein LTR94_016818 [Friedmanniomyces endolithicus]KAK0779125.1 hypothetical protein LTR59_013258 [Friedmanniomyces endolithicus]KAK0797376.1 hypothetical protein LTR75_009861 [Friedmanniomyces endolithicus]KAK0837018.1 hypothetical protein LTS02_018041 [Friedmanniomyces endolithicus]KAK0841702.1 hypothetical protein LTR03_009715 [Friedmanniomyces endolithicus]
MAFHAVVARPSTDDKIDHLQFWSSRSVAWGLVSSHISLTEGIEDLDMTSEELEPAVTVRRDHVNEFQRLRGPETRWKRAEDKVMKKALGVEDGEAGAKLERHLGSNERKRKPPVGDTSPLPPHKQRGTTTAEYMVKRKGVDGES